MVVPLIGRWLAAVVGGLLVLAAGASVIGTLIVPRPVGSRLTRWVDRFVSGRSSLVTTAIADFRRRDRVLARQAAAILLMQLAAWLGVAFLGYGLLLWPFVPGGLGSAFIVAGSSLFTLGFAEPGGAPSAIVFAAAATGLVIVDPADRLPADAVRGVQPQRDRGGAAERAGRGAVLGPGASGTHPLRAGIRHLDHRYAARPVCPVGTLGGRRHGKPYHLPAAGAVPLAPAAVLLGNCAAGGAGLRRPVPGAVPQSGAGGPGSPVPAERVHCASPRSPERWALRCPRRPTRVAGSA